MGRVLLILMWKHLMVRMRRFIHTPVEIISPTLMFIVLFCAKDILLSPKRSVENTPVILPEPLSLDSWKPPTKVLYYPDTPLSNSFMNTVAPKIMKRESLSKINRTIPVIPIKNTSYLRDDLLKTMNKTDALVIFEDMSGTQLPANLKYSIRTRKNYLTGHYKSLDERITSHQRFSSIYSEFARLQWAIDSQYISMRSNRTIDQKINMQELPYTTNTEDTGRAYILTGAMLWICWLSLIIPFVFIMCRLLEESASGTQELVKMVHVSVNTLSFSHFLNTLPTGLSYSIVGTILLTVTDNPYIMYTSPFIVFVTLALHYITVMYQGFFCAYLIRSTNYMASIAIFAYVVLITPTGHLRDKNVLAFYPVTGLLPHMPISWIWYQIGDAEYLGTGVKDITTTYNPHNKSVMIGYIFLVLQAALFFLLSWYLSLVRPGKYGQALPWNFLCKAQYWRKQVEPSSDDDSEAPITTSRLYFEDAPPNLEAGIKICNVTKQFKNHKALSNVSLDVYRGEITVLVGHNGAGKTTLMSIITGMMSASSGAVYVNGYDTRTQMALVRQEIGLCPQHNLLFPDLNVLQHVIFFSWLKTGTYHEAKKSALSLIERLGLSNKVNSLAVQLSGGMKRRLQLACALSGNASVLVLDEPTAGLDVETRRGLWDLLLSLRGSSTLLISTHFMEEADALGDRVAALKAGSVVCHATVMHLKRAIGTGYRVSFTTVGEPKEEEITAAMKKFVPDASIKEKAMGTLSYTLPAAHSNVFPKLFNFLEENKPKLGIDTIGVGRTNLEDVFLKLCSDSDAYSDLNTALDTENERPLQKATGFVLLGRQIAAILLRQFIYLRSKKIIAMQLILSIICFIGLALLTNNSAFPSEDKETNNKTLIGLSMYPSDENLRVLYKYDSNLYPVEVMNFTFEYSPDALRTVYEAAEKNVHELSKYLLAIEINDTDIRILYTTAYRHTMPVALNLLSNLLAARYVNGSSGPIISTYNDPILEASLPTSYSAKNPAPKSQIALKMLALLTSLLTVTTLTLAASLPCAERVSGARRLHTMSGCAPEVRWAGTLLHHALLFAVLLVLPAVLALVLLDKDNTLNNADAASALLAVLSLGCLANLPFMYYNAQFYSERVTNILIIVIVVIFVIFTPQFHDSSNGFLKFLADTSIYIVPVHTLAVAMNAFCDVAYVNAQGIGVTSYYEVKSLKIGAQLIILAVQAVAYMLLTILAERGLFNMFDDISSNINFKPQTTYDEDANVRAEKVYVQKAIDLPSSQSDALLADDLHKNYKHIIGKSCYAVKGLSLSIKKGECLGLLGVNGAGKSTTFKMITLEEYRTKGRLYNGHFPRFWSNDYLTTLSYCPQFFGLDDFMTGANNLMHLLKLYGLSHEDALTECNFWLDLAGLQKYRDKKVSGYSGGCLRRLACAAALCLRAPLALLDEPSAGVDVAARRQLWRALRRALHSRDRAMLITSHSMDEMEALCSRIAIMAGGRVVALGSPAALRAQHAAGHSVMFKLRAARAAPSGDVTDGASKDLSSFKTNLAKKFQCTLKDEHKTMLNYHIKDTLAYSELFTQIEKLKTTFPNLIEDYSVTETTLEEVFLSFAAENQLNKLQTQGPIQV